MFVKILEKNVIKRRIVQLKVGEGLKSVQPLKLLIIFLGERKFFQCAVSLE